MADIGQSTFIGSDIIIQCDENWTCCQREQAKAKTDKLNEKCPLNIRKSVSARSKRAKKNCCARETGRFIREMTANPDAASKKNTTSPCLAEKVKDDWDNGKKSTRQMGVQMDHDLEVKLGGPARGTLKALDEEINGFFGNIVAKNTGDNMRAKGRTEVESVSLVCKPPCPPPKKSDKNNDFSTGKRKKFPKVVSPDRISPKP